MQLDPTREDPGAGAPVPIRLDVSVVGEPEFGPRYVHGGEARPGAPFGERLPTAAAASPAAATRIVIGPAGWAAIGTGALLVLGLVVGVVVRRRRS